MVHAASRDLLDAFERVLPKPALEEDHHGRMLVVFGHSAMTDNCYLLPESEYSGNCAGMLILQPLPSPIVLVKKISRTVSLVNACSFAIPKKHDNTDYTSRRGWLVMGGVGAWAEF